MNPKIGDERNGYIVVSERLSRGSMAMGYRAEKNGRTVFLKQYISPMPTKEWFEGYVAYQQELKRRVESNPQLKSACYEFVEFFVATAPPRHSDASRRYYQVFEWVTGGKDLAEVIGEFRANPTAHPWERRLTWAKVIMGSIARLHEQKVAHIDLKPENLILIPRPDIGIGYQLKLIDMDFSLLTDRPAPWHGIEGYVGTPKWWSPEHMTTGQVPGTHSDVFTCGLILYDLLAGGNPYFDLDEPTYQTRAMAHAAPPPVLAGPMPAGNDAEIKALLHRCLSPTASARPTAAEVQAALNARPAVRPPPAPVTAPAPAPAAAAVTAPAPTPASAPTPVTAPAVVPATAPATEPTPRVVGPLTLTHGGVSQVVNITTDFNRRGLTRFGEDARFWDNEWQLKLHRREDGWYVVPNPGSPNETLLNGKAIVSARKLTHGDILAVGREATGIQKLPLTVSMETP